MKWQCAKPTYESFKQRHTYCNLFIKEKFPQHNWFYRVFQRCSELVFYSHRRWIFILLVLSLEPLGVPSPVYCQHHFPCVKINIQLVCVMDTREQYKYNNSTVAGRILHIRDTCCSVLAFVYLTGESILPSMCNEKLHGLFYSGSERILASQQQQQLGRWQLQQHACDFTGKRLRTQNKKM